MVEQELNDCGGEGPSLARNRQKVLDKYFRTEDSTPTPGLYADPALMFGGVKA